MRIDIDPRLPTDDDQQRLKTRLYTVFRSIAMQLNILSEGRLAARYNATTSAPSSGAWAQGDVVWNSNPTEAGSAGSKYVVTHWICTVSGSPGTWVQCRSLTGN